MVRNDPRHGQTPAELATSELKQNFSLDQRCMNRKLYIIYRNLIAISGLAYPQLSALWILAPNTKIGFDPPKQKCV